MPGYNQDQLNFDIPPDQPDVGSESLESSNDEETEMVYRNPVTGMLVSDRTIEDYAQVRPCSLYEAFSYFGVTPEDAVRDKDGAGLQPVEVKKRKTNKIFASVNRAERATHLLGALEEHSQSVQANDNMYNLLTGDYDRDKVDGEAYSEMMHRQAGDRNFFKAWGTKALRDSGIKSGYLSDLARSKANEFFELTSNPENNPKIKEKRDKLVAELTRQKDSR